MQVLIVEDDPNLRLLWRTVFGDRGFGVTECESLAAAKDIIRSEPHDLVVLDLYLGRENGLELIGAIAADHPSTRIVVVTGASEARVPKAGGAVFSVLRKPVDIEDLLAICNAALEDESRDGVVVPAAGRADGRGADSGP